MANIRKLKQSTPFLNFELYEEDYRYHSIKSDEELVKFFHEMLTKYEGSKFITLYLYEMIAYGVNANLNLIPKSI